MTTVTPIKNILIPYDGSPQSKNALQYAIVLTKLVSGQLTILKSYNVAMETTTADATTGIYPIALTEFKEITEDELSELNAEFKELNDIPYKTISSPGVLITAIELYTEDNPIDVIIMGTHGASGWEEFLGGSTTANMVGNTDSTPLWVVPYDVKSYETPKRIAIAVDPDNIPAAEKLTFLDEVSTLFSAEVSVVYVADKKKGSIDSFAESIDKNAEVYWLQGDIDDALLDFSINNDIDILFAVHKDRNFFASLFHSSVAKKIVSHTSIPVVVL
ncbi:universal stress protein [Fulvivirga maritima]|uniref:universal stress protein n=1 Tax=Fulvivirga maritima TaxID=2904247 RepID=UPI001F369DB1|nr:universal stress protein [Fulvivirga maritima]UII27243.1 universal stress protein [Fulvivirga maritima]